MGWYANSTQGTIFEQFPKVDLHRHLEGSLRLRTLAEIAEKNGAVLPTQPNLGGLVQMQETDPLTVNNFLAKFSTLRLFYRSPEIIQRIAREAVEDAAVDHVRYLELKFTPVALSRMQNYPINEVIQWVADAVQEAARRCQVQTRLIISVNRHEPLELAEKVIGMAVDYRDAGVVGVDLAGNEVEFSALPFAGLFRQAKAAGLALTIHAGEWGTAANVREAIEVMQADRIGHGVRVLEDPRVVALAVERGIPFEVCVTSNYHTGVVADLKSHPLLRMLQAGLRVTLNTDDPGISGITLSDEYQVVCKELGLPIDQLKKLVLDAAQSSFLNPIEKIELAKQLAEEINNT